MGPRESTGAANLGRADPTAMTCAFLSPAALDALRRDARGMKAVAEPPSTPKLPLRRARRAACRPVLRALRAKESGDDESKHLAGKSSSPRWWKVPSKILSSVAAAGFGLTAAAALGPALSRFVASGRDSTSVQSFVQPAFAYSRYAKKSIREKLAQVPVFAVTNSSGQPYLANVDGRQQVGLIFFSQEDANKMLKDMLKNPGSSDARVYIMGLDKAYEMVRAKPTPSGVRGPRGEEQTMVFRFYPDSKQVKYATQLARKLRYPQFEGVPIFVAKGLSITKGGESIVPLFFTKEDLESAWAKLREAKRDLPSKPVIDVANLLIIIRLMEEDENAELRNFGFFAPRDSVEFVNREKGVPKGKARLHQNPFE